MHIVCSRVAVLIAAVIIIADVHATTIDDTVPIGNPESCQAGPMQQFGRYVGNWIMEDETLSQDGATWVAGKGARWNFVCLGNGTAIQDFWMPTDGEVGTNLRTYNSSTESWDIAWVVKPQPGYSQIEAKHQANDTIVMHVVKPVPNPLRRITFHPPDNNGWRWTLAFSQDDGKSWRDVYRMKATPAP